MCFCLKYIYGRAVYRELRNLKN